MKSIISFQSSHFSYMTKKLRQKFKYLEKKKSTIIFFGRWKSYFKFDGQKIHVFSTYFFQRNVAGRKIHVVFTYFCQCKFDGRKDTSFKEVMIISMKYLSLKNLFCGEKILFYLMHKTKLFFLLVLTYSHSVVR